ncbi:aldo/keto reductase [Streptomyces sp. WAC05374]|uniref:aldo/keto reductase n=1 Tax=Streptomyces sp. WAC05374 TaxID=2487420 RepID=UPI000F87DCC1|nr:aldo/keto reductase [Streptomyces sp. WAC05374]RST17924.1 aldo/keto reductase [Streptomyces sp. WAC05374]TDF42700.1 aldo/keto reductase [Streptomyces sp. WAC05374]TDF51259.1 aldo/keto reductase [Streptomyces sp. WAC05374]TDF52572.1 aldo/keto reductase [Streptomyces sp. WAC05374]
MRYTLFGRTGLRVSELALGAMTMGGDGEDEPNGRILDMYADAGGNFVDTADIYGAGASETVLGRLLEGRRDRFVLASKYTCATDADDMNSGGNHRKNLVRSVEASLGRLRTDRLDVLWVHARDELTPVEELMRALDDLVRAGKVLYLGVSDWPAWEIAQANTLAELRGWTSFAGSQLRYSLLERTPERELLPQARGFDQAVFAWAPLAAGKLTGKYRRGETGRLADGAREDEREAAVITAVQEIAGQGGWSPAQVALAWLRGRPGNIVPLIGAGRPDQLADNLGCLDVELDAAAVERLDRVSAVPLGFPHDFLAEPGIVRNIHGDRRADIDDRRTWRASRSDRR